MRRVAIAVWQGCVSTTLDFASNLLLVDVEGRKEAARKALGTGWRHGVRWRDIEVTREGSGKPGLRLEGVAREFADRLGVRNIALTITHSGNLALAQVIFEN